MRTWKHVQNGILIWNFVNKIQIENGTPFDPSIQEVTLHYHKTHTISCNHKHSFNCMNRSSPTYVHGFDKIK